MKVKSVVKVMNFYSLLRVDSAKRKAEKFFGYEESVKEFIDNIVNNKNLILDKKMIKMNNNGKDLNIYIANDMGFCGSFNSNINEVLRKDNENDKIIIGKKIIKKDKYENIILSMTKDEYLSNVEPIYNIMFESLNSGKYKAINIIYNHYYNVSKIERVKETIFPLEKQDKKSDNYQEDFAVEGDLNSILLNVIALYLGYEIQVAVQNSYASENIMRQMITKESLKKIDEMEAEKLREKKKVEKIKNLKKQLDNVNKMNLNT